MVKRFITTLGMIALALSMFAQTPQQFSYQAVVRNDEGKLVSEESVDLIIAILQGNADGDAVYTETQTATTNKNGLLSLQVGNGSSSDDFSAINWANGPYFLKTQIMVDGKAIETVSQLLAVPYALYAEKVANLPDMSNFVTKEELQNLSKTGNVATKDTLAYYITTTKLEDTLDYYLLDSDIPDWAKAEEKPTYDYSEIENVPEIPNVSGLATKDTLSYYTTTEKLEDTLDYYLLDSDVPDWAKAEEKPTYDYSEITNAPEIPNVEGLASKEFVKDTIAFYATVEKLEDTLDYYLLDSDVPDWAKAEEKPTYDYSEIANTPELPSVDGLASKEFVKDTIAFYATTEKLEDTLDYYLLDSDVPDWAKAEEKPTYDYSEIANTPTIPTTVASLEDAEDYALKTEIPTKVSDLDEAENYALKTDLTPLANVQADWNEVDEESEAYIKNKPAIPSIEGLATTTYVDGKVEGLASEEFVQDTLDFYLLDSDVPDWAKAEEKPAYDYSEIANTPTIPTTVASLEDAEDYALKTEIPTKVSDLDEAENYALKTDLTPLANVQADWNEADEESEAYIKNKPAIPSIDGLASKEFVKDTIAFYATIEKMEDTLDYYLLDEDIPDWAKAEEKPTYDYSEITNAPEIPNVEGLASKEFVKDTIAFYATTEKLEDTLDYYLLDSDVPDWAKAEEKPTYDYSEIANTPEIPNVEGLASKEFVKDTIAFYATVEKMEDTLDYYLLDSDVPDWAKAEEKPTYDYSEITNAPEIPNVEGLASKEFVKDTIAFYATVEKLEDTLDYYLLDSDVPDWAKAEEKPTYDYSEITNAPEIPNVEGLASKEFVKDTIAFYPTTEKMEDTLDYYLLDSDVPDWAKAEEKPTYDYSEIANTPTIPTTVASLEDAEDYALKSDLTSLANVQADWNVADEESDAYIKNKPTKVSDFENDAEYVTKAEYDELKESYDDLKASFRKQTLGMMCNLAPNTIYKGALLSTFSVGPDKKVVFSQGNLQYRRGGEHLTAEGTMAPGTWRFAEHQYDAVGGEALNEKGNDVAGIGGNVYYNGVKCDNILSVDENYEGWFDLFGYATSGWNNGKNVYQPGQFTNGDITPSDYLIRELIGTKKYADWGVYNAISNGGNSPEQWRTLKKEEWLYLIYDRPNASNLFAPGIIHLDAPTENGVEYMYGIIILPDDWTSCPAGCSIVTTKSLSGTTYSYTKGFDVSYEYRNEYTETQWAAMQSYGAVFLPCAGSLRYDDKYTNREDKLCMIKTVSVNSLGCYFMATSGEGNINSNMTSYFYFSSTQLKYTARKPNWAMNVRLVSDVE